MHGGTVHHELLLLHYFIREAVREVIAQDKHMLPVKVVSKRTGIIAPQCGRGSRGAE